MVWRDFILNNIWWKITALFLAVVVWVTFHSSDELQSLVSLTSSRSFVRHPVTVMKAANDVRNFRLAPDEVDITVSGEVSLIRSLAGSDLHAFVDLTRIKTNKVNSAKVQVYRPRGVRLERVVPDAVRLELIKP
ncbi:MAG: hypothetical protein AAB466_06555 [Verrucomicrobiota bacterium]